MKQGSPSTALTLTTAAGLGSFSPSPGVQDPPVAQDTSSD
jgi:hypothetical protein